MSAEVVQQRVRKFVLENFHVPDVGALADDASLISEGIVDSTGMLEIIGFLESEYDLKISDQETVPENLDSITRIAAFVGRKRQARG